MEEGYRNGLGFNAIVNNFGFGIGMEYKRVVSSFSEVTATVRWTGLRDVSEQVFTDFFGQQLIPNKYKRAFAFPAFFGFRQRVFGEAIDDNFRFYLEAASGPVAAFTYPYFRDDNNNGFRETFTIYNEPVYDVLTGIGDGSWKLGLGGELKLSLDVGDNFSRLTSIQFGYTFYYFHQGVQVMIPNQPIRKQQPAQGEFQFELTPEECTEYISGTCDLRMQPFYPSQSFFGSPQISFIFGRMW
ncbi:MAG: hypothetical protein WD094_02145 [Balneolaceae bacterium]